MSRLLPLLLLFGLATAIPSCKQSKQRDADATSTRTILNLSPGDQWNYSVKLTSYLTAQLPPNIISADSGGTSCIYELERNYLGLQAPTEGHHPETHCFQEKREGKIKDTEYLHITPDTLQILAWKGEGMPAPIVFKPAITLLSPSYKSGSEWKGRVKDSEGRIIMERVFRHHGQETVLVPAGKFQAIKIEERGRNMGVEISRLIWFARGVGIVREESSHYSKKRRLFHQVKELNNYRKGSNN